MRLVAARHTPADHELVVYADEDVYIEKPGREPLVILQQAAVPAALLRNNRLLLRVLDDAFRDTLPGLHADMGGFTHMRELSSMLKSRRDMRGGKYIAIMMRDCMYEYNYLLLTQYRVAIKVRVGDVVILNSREWHAEYYPSTWAIAYVPPVRHLSESKRLVQMLKDGAPWSDDMLIDHVFMAVDGVVPRRIGGEAEWTMTGNHLYIAKNNNGKYTINYREGADIGAVLEYARGILFEGLA